MPQDNCRPQQECEEPSMSQICCCASKCLKILVSLLSVVWIALAIAEIVIGAVYLHRCPRQRYIPIWLIVNGCTVILIHILTMVAACRPNKAIYGLLTLLGLFWFAWLITGSVWTFHIYPNYEGCDRVVYLFAFSILIIQWIILAFYLPAVLMKLISMCSSCSACESCTSCSMCSRCASCCCCSFLTKY
ncbi:transmembrane protein 272-like [Ambystoma mexicanum]|uniref:transmembrane protein 272-like n=1 Tax=Ambystoma mexicanum TaxID=8296 RepID=UPI0037E7F749